LAKVLFDAFGVLAGRGEFAMNENDRRHSIKPVQRRLLAPLALVLLLLIGGFAAAMLSLQKYYLDKKIEDEVEAASNQLKQNLRREASLLAFVEETIVADRRLHDALKSTDRERLATNYQELFSRIREMHEITHFYFHLPDRTNLLRLHQPERYGDVVERFTLRQAERISRGIRRVGETGSPE
jgi:Double sensory domain of two-component sensor kinase